jgi:hypothetical protein
MVPADEPVDVADVGRAAGRRWRGRCRAVRAAWSPELGEGLDPLLAGLDLAVDAFQLGYQPSAGLAGDVARPGGRDQGTGLRRGQELLGSAGQEFQQQPVAPVDGLSTGRPAR